VLALGLSVALAVLPVAPAHADDTGGADAIVAVTENATPDMAAAAINRDNAAVLAAARSKKVVADPKATKASKGYRLPLRGTNADRPTRQGVILVTSDAFKGLIPTGHAAIVWSKDQVIESIASGVKWGSNNWALTKKEAFGVTVKSTTVSQDSSAAAWVKKQLNKPYNLAYWNIDTRVAFYCSQLVWAAFKDNYKVDLNTSAYGYWGVERVCPSSTSLPCILVPKYYNPVHPMELVATSLTNTIWHYKA
jgi:uncharacterized protein YycO